MTPQLMPMHDLSRVALFDLHIHSLQLGKMMTWTRYALLNPQLCFILGLIRGNEGVPDFPSGVAGAVTPLVPLLAPQVGILPGLPLLGGVAGLVHNAAIISAQQPARWVQQETPLQ